MKFMEKAKRFFTLKRRANDGFTLVELIVVIAILAILAGVAVPAYSGYIEKSKEAADQTLLVAVNKAFAAACLQNSVDPISMADGSATAALNDGVVTTVTAEGIPTINADFFVYYEGNENEAFQTIESLQFVGGVFMDITKAPSQNLNFKGQDYKVNQISINNYKDSVFFGKEENLQQDLQNLTNSYGDIAGKATPEQLAEMFGSDYAEYLKDAGAEDANSIGNATVLYVADKTAGMTAQSAGDALLAAQAALASGKGIQDLEDPLTTTAMMYGAVTAYANGAGKDSALAEQLAKGVTNQSDLLKLFDAASKDSNFLGYVGTVEDDGTLTIGSDFTKDMNGYLGALDAMSSVSGGVDVTEGGLWAGTDISGLLNQLK